jgi:FMN reductase
MEPIVVFCGSPVAGSRTQALGEWVARHLGAQGLETTIISVGDLPAEDLISGRAESLAMLRALRCVEMAPAVVIITPVYKASYSGVTKVFLDLLPQRGLAGKVILPLAVGGSLAHVLTLDYALRPVLASLAASHVTAGLFLLDQRLERLRDGTIRIDAEVATELERVLCGFAHSMRMFVGPALPSGALTLGGLVPVEPGAGA